MQKRYFSLFLAVLFIFSLLQTPAFASSEEPYETRASSYLDMYGATLQSPSVSGKLDLVFEVIATDYMDSVGVLGIFVKNNDGSIHSVIWGSNANGLLDSNTWCHFGVYRLSLTSGNTYYCSVVVIAEDANGGDTRTINTNRVTCP